MENRIHAEIFKTMDTLIEDRGLWRDFVQAADEAGYTPQQVCAALNANSVAAGFGGDLTVDDCEP